MSLFRLPIYQIQLYLAVHKLHLSYGNNFRKLNATELCLGYGLTVIYSHKRLHEKILKKILTPAVTIYSKVKESIHVFTSLV